MFENLLEDYFAELKNDGHDKYSITHLSCLLPFAVWLDNHAAQHGVYLTAYRRWLWVSICINVVLLLVVASTFGGR